MAKHVRMGDVDRISSLPDSILSHILSFLTIREAVGTSILSSRWRYLFALLKNLEFDLYDKRLLRRKNSRRANLKGKSYMSFVDAMMFLHNATSIEKFSLSCGEAVDSSRAYGWLCVALWRGVQHLDLDIHIYKFTTLPHVLFTCRTLVTLKLKIVHDFVLNVPNEVYLPNLKTLHIHSMKFLNDDSVRRLLSGCISLEDMALMHCSLSNISQLNISYNFLKRLTLMSCQYFAYMWIVIDAPMLVHFKYDDSLASGYSLKNLQSLVSAEIRIHIMEFIHGRYRRLTDATSFFRGICNVQSLNLSSVSLQFLLSCESVPVFPNLVQLKISYVSFERPASRYYYLLGEGLATLLRDSPELKDLDFFQGIVGYLPENVRSCLLFNVKAIEIVEFENEEECIEMAKYFLKNAGVLEKLTMRTSLTSDLAENEKLKIVEDLLASPRKSKPCCIVFV